jgi:hypothetical protein
MCILKGEKNPDVDGSFCNLPDRPWGPPSLMYNGYGVIPGVKAAETWR